MARIMFVTDNWSVNGTVVSQSGGAGADAARLLDIDPSVVWKTADDGSGNFTLTGSLTDIDTFILGYGAFTQSTTTWQIEAAVDEPSIGVSNLIDVNLPLWLHPGLESIPYVHAVYHLPTPIQAGAVRITTSDTISPGNGFTFGRLAISKAFIPSINFSHGAGYGFGNRDLTQVSRGPNGRVTLRRDPKIFSGQVVMDLQGRVDTQSFQRLNLFYGSSYPVYVIYNLDDLTLGHDQIVHALLQWNDPPIVSSPVVNRFRVSIGMEEMGA
jgi:hypothetical protein